MKADVGIVILGLMFVTWGCFDSESESDLVETQSTADTSDAAMEPETSQPWPLDLYLDLPSDILTQDLAETLDPDLGDISEVEAYDEAYAGDGCETIVPPPLSEWQGSYRYTTTYYLPQSVITLLIEMLDIYWMLMSDYGLALVSGISAEVTATLGESLSDEQFQEFLAALQAAVSDQLAPEVFGPPSPDPDLDKLFETIEFSGDGSAVAIDTVENSLSLTAELDTLTVYWTYGCSPTDLPCQKRDLPISVLGGQKPCVDWLANLLETKVVIHKHTVDGDLGHIANIIMKELVMPEIFGQPDLAMWADEKIDCAGLAVDLAVELTEIGLTPAQLVEFCLASRDAWLLELEAFIDSYSMPVSFITDGKGDFADDDYDGVADYLEGTWEGSLELGMSASELFTGHFKAIKN